MKDLSDIGIEKPGFIFITDGGPDWSPKFMKNILALGKFWKKNKLDFLIQITYAPGHSAQNPIEHLWSPLSNFLTGVFLKATLPEEKPPNEQTGISNEVKKEKECLIYDQAVSDLNSYWHNRKFDSFTINSRGVKCADASAATEVDPMEACIKAGIRKLQTDFKECVKDVSFFIKHLDRRSYLIKFQKCTECDFCKENPVRAPKAMAFLMKHSIFTPTPYLDDDPGEHFMTFLECISNSNAWETVSRK
jgi:hypothetical protein